MDAGWRLRAVGAAALCVAAFSPALAQTSDVCARLEAQLAMQQPAVSGDASSHDEATGWLRTAVEDARSRARAAGCGRRGTVPFQPPGMETCNALDADIRRMEADLRRLAAEREHLAPQPSLGDKRMVRMLLTALAENDCGPQYARFAKPRGNMPDASAYSRTGTFRTVCVRMCDGYYWPISFRAMQGQFGRDARACAAACGGSEVALYVYRNPGQDIEQAVSLDGAPYTALPNALRYRREYVEDCGCRSIAEDAPAPDHGQSAAGAP